MGSRGLLPSRACKPGGPCADGWRGCACQRYMRKMKGSCWPSQTPQGRVQINAEHAPESKIDRIALGSLELVLRLVVSFVLRLNLLCAGRVLAMAARGGNS